MKNLTRFFPRNHGSTSPGAATGPGPPRGGLVPRISKDFPQASKILAWISGFGLDLDFDLDLIRFWDGFLFDFA